MPTARYGHVRKLLKVKLAVPICNNPFTIKLKYDTPDIVQDLWLGIDAGRENIGVGVSKENGECVFLSELKTNNRSIKKNMDVRRQHRRARRMCRRLRKQRKALRDNTAFQSGDNNILKRKECKSRDISYPGMERSITCKAVKGAEAQFSNRKKRCGLTPSARQLIQMHLLMVKSVAEFLPISHIILEKNVFDFQKLENQDIRTWEYGKGILYGYKDYKEYIHAQQNGICLLCGCARIDNYHHIVPLSKGGSDTPSNIAGLCDRCHHGAHGVHKDADAADRLSEKKAGLKQKYSVSLLNTVVPYLIEELQGFCGRKGITFSLTEGYETCKTRERYDLVKRHSMDGYAISISDRETENTTLPDFVYIRQRFKKKSAANIQKLNFRGYYVVQDGKEILVARNRHKAEGQTADSLEEYMDAYAVNHSAEECAAHLKSLAVKPAKRVYLAHRRGLWSDIHAGDAVKYEKRNKIKGNVKQNVFIATGISILEGKIKSGTKSRKTKFCYLLNRGCIPFIYKVPI